MEGIEHTEITAGLWHLRPPRESEAADLLELSADPGVRLYTPRTNGVDTEERAREQLRQWAAWEERIVFSILEPTTERYAGHVMVFRLDRENSAAEIGYRVASWARGRGAATTAVRCVTGWAFGALGLERITLAHSVGNDASCRVAEKNGYLLEGVHRSSFRGGDGLLHDTHLHARLASD
ncbi:GNAT family N-acetyltransferase [Actinocorallia populi]|uniref:GNAT family N-acetyltransferase n=1 Tax=Actinocorallia populi TaxID=2079200 RepID=UPI00130033BB|nr:GNAT family protein [Actinocorallia populi]